MSLYQLSIKRPVFISCLLITIIVVGYLFFSRLEVDLFPKIDFPTVSIVTPYSNASPEESEILITKVLEDAISPINGIRKIKSTSKEGASIITIEFTLETDIKYAEQQVRDKVNSVMKDLPLDVNYPVIRRLDPEEQAILRLSLSSEKLSAKELFSLADQTIKLQLEQIKNVAQVDILGGEEREIQINVDQRELFPRKVSLIQIANLLRKGNKNIPAGKFTQGPREMRERDQPIFYD